MAKRARGSSTRPGQRAPIQRTPTRPKTPDVPTETALSAYAGQSLTDADLARAAELEAQIVAQERAAEAAKQGPRTREPAPRATGSLAVAAAEEYAYVARDIRRITLIGGSLIALLIGAWALIQVTGVGLFQ